MAQDNRKIIYDRVVKAVSPTKGHRDMIQALSKEFPGKTVHQSFLRCDVAITNTDELKFTINDQATATNTVNISERRLSVNNYFVVTHVGLFLKACAATAAGHGPAVLHTYPNLAAFPNGTASLNADLEAIYNGYKTFKTGQTVFIPAMETALFRKVPMFPKGQELSVAVGPIVKTVQQSPRNSQDGFYELPGRLLIDGSLTHQLSLVVPGGSALKMAYDVAGTTFYATWVARGVEIETI